MNKEKAMKLSQSKFGKALIKLCDDTDNYSYGESKINASEIVKDCQRVISLNKMNFD